MNAPALPLSGLFILRFNSLAMLDGHPWVLPAQTVAENREVFRIGGWKYNRHCEPLHPCAPDIAEAWAPDKDNRTEMMRRRTSVETFLTTPSTDPDASLRLVDAALDRIPNTWSRPVIRPSWGILRDLLHINGIPLSIGTFQRCATRCPIRAYRGVPVEFRRAVRCEVGGTHQGIYEALPIMPRGTGGGNA